MKPLLVMTNLPDQDSARRVAEALIDERLAACVNVFAPCVSTYRWRGAVETAQEFPLLVKTTESRYDKVEAAILKHHPYELPEIVAVPICAGLPGYLAWIAAETDNDKESAS